MSKVNNNYFWNISWDKIPANWSESNLIFERNSGET